ncbi:Radial spoke protein 7 [Balamuthia mandrillaris]
MEASKAEGWKSGRKRAGSLQGAKGIQLGLNSPADIDLNEYRELKKKVAVMEANKLEKKRDKVRKVFNAVDADGSGALDFKEFQALAFKLGLTLTDEEAKQSLKQLDTDGNGTVDFEEFFSWWKSEKEHGTQEGEKLRLLKLKLHSKQVLQNLTHFTSVLAKSSSSLKNNTAASKQQQGSLSVQLQVGEFAETAASSISFSQSYAAESVSTLRKSVEADEATLIVVFSFAVKPGQDAFALGELSGSIKNIVSMAFGQEKRGTKFQRVETKLSKGEGDQQVYDMYFVFDVKNSVDADAINDILQELQLNDFTALLELAQKPTLSESEELVKFRLAVNAAYKRQNFRSLVEDLVRSEMSDDWAIADFLNLLVRLQNIALQLQFDDLATFFDEGRRGVLHFLPPNIYNYLGFHAIQQILPSLAEVICDPELPAPVRETYEAAQKTLSSLNGIKVAFGVNLFEVRCLGLDLFDGYLPSLEQLAAIRDQAEKRERELREKLEIQRNEEN